MHRAENVDDPDRLRNLVNGLHQIGEEYQQPVVVSLHPRTADKLRQFNVTISPERVRLLKAMGFFDFVALERNARVVLTDSGTVQEECCILRVPNVTIRDVTERPETVECGSNILSSVEPHMIVGAVDIVLNSLCDWTPPAEYMEERVSATVARIVLGYHCPSGQR
jgi:UDP-N-acetylglucosamine 2-epimerase (non-hydrolysing)